MTGVIVSFYDVLVRKALASLSVFPFDDTMFGTSFLYILIESPIR